MSTAGKVLIVLVLLLIPLWAILMSGIAELNRNGGQAIAKLEAQVAKLQEDVTATEAKIQSLKDSISLEQVATGEDMVVLRARQASVEQMRSEAIEIESRMKIALESMQAALKNAELDRDHRAAEKKQMETDLARGEAEVEQLKARHTELSARLSTLRNQFKDAYLANKQKVERLVK